MLVIMLLGMMHNAFPHVHHVHEVSVDEELKGESHHHHHDSSHHHHPGEDDNDQENKNFLDFLFKNHSHTQHTHQYTSATVEHVKPVKQIEIKAFGSSDPWEFTANKAGIGLHRYVLFDDVGSDDPYSDSHPLRGPPALG